MKDDIIQKAEFNPAVKTLFLVIPCVAMAVTLIGIPLAILWLIYPGWVYSRKYYDSLYCTLTESKLKFAKGVLVRVEKTIPLENIQDLTFVEGPILKLFGLSMLKIETAGNSSSSSADMRLIGIVDAQDFRNRVLDQRDVLTGKDAPANHQQEMLSVLREIRDLLKKQ